MRCSHLGWDTRTFGYRKRAVLDMCPVTETWCLDVQRRARIKNTRSLAAGPGGRAVQRRRSAAAGFLGLRVRIPPGTWMSNVSTVLCQVEVYATG